MADDKTEKPLANLPSTKSGTEAEEAFKIAASKIAGTSHLIEQVSAFETAAKKALGPSLEQMQLASERYRTLVEPSAATRAAIEALSARTKIESIYKSIVDNKSFQTPRYNQEFLKYAEGQADLQAKIKSIIEPSGLRQLKAQIDKAAQIAISADRIAALRSVDLSRYNLPTAASIAERLIDPNVSRLFAPQAALALDLDRIAKAAAGMQTPWMEAANSAASIARFANLHALGATINLKNSYSNEATDAVRRSLGDWRNPTTRSPDTLVDLSARTEFYVERGLDRTLTDWPEEAFEESLDVTEIRGEPPPLVAIYGAPIIVDLDGEGQAAFARNNRAHNWLQVFETQIRQFIDRNMTHHFGDRWPRSQLPNGMLDNWLRKQSSDPHRGRHDRLIVYADFQDYEPIVCRADNFKKAFASYFQRKEHFKESMHRLALPRIEVMHARLLTKDDELLLFAELRRLSNLIMRSS